MEPLTAPTHRPRLLGPSLGGLPPRGQGPRFHVTAVPGPVTQPHSAPSVVPTVKQHMTCNGERRYPKQVFALTHDKRGVAEHNTYLRTACWPCPVIMVRGPVADEEPEGYGSGKQKRKQQAAGKGFWRIIELIARTSMCKDTVNHIMEDDCLLEAESEHALEEYYWNNDWETNVSKHDLPESHPFHRRHWEGPHPDGEAYRFFPNWLHKVQRPEKDSPFSTYSPHMSNLMAVNTAGSRCRGPESPSGMGEAVWWNWRRPPKAPGLIRGNRGRVKYPGDSRYRAGSFNGGWSITKRGADMMAKAKAGPFRKW